MTKVENLQGIGICETNIFLLNANMLSTIYDKLYLREISFKTRKNLKFYYYKRIRREKKNE